jgi:hypothetical protein
LNHAGCLSIHGLPISVVCFGGELKLMLMPWVIVALLLL